MSSNISYDNLNLPDKRWFSPFDRQILGFVKNVFTDDWTNVVFTGKIITYEDADYLGNRVKKTNIETLVPHRYYLENVIHNNITYSIPRKESYSKWREVPFFQTYERKIYYNILGLDSNEILGYTNHPIHNDYFALFQLQLEKVYNGISFDEIIDFLKSIKTTQYSFAYFNNKHDEEWSVYSRIEIESYLHKTFFIDLLQRLEIYWIDESDKNIGIAKQIGSGFYRKFDYFGSVPIFEENKWNVHEYNNDKSFEHLAEWFSIQKANFGKYE